MITKVLSPAMRLWLRSLTSHVSHLEVNISGGDRQLLSGYIPRVSIVARQAVYQGLHLSDVQLVGENIRVNLSQVLKGKPLQLLQRVPVFGEVRLQAEDLNASMRSPLLANALTDLVTTLLPDYPLAGINWQQIMIDCDRLTLKGSVKNSPLIIQSHLHLASAHELHLEKIQIQTPQEIVNLDNLHLDLGNEVAIEELTITSNQLVCRGQINIVPVDV